MNTFRFTTKVLAIAMFTFAFVSLVQAQNTRSYVSGTGDDANPCSRTFPCKTFSSAQSKTLEGGEIDALDPGGYGSFTITKAITIDGGTGSGWASVLASGGGNGIIVNITNSAHPNDAVVILRNITFQGMSQSSTQGTSGILYLKAAQLHVENCQFENFTTTGITASLGTTSGALTVQDCVFDNVGMAVMSTVNSPAFNVLLFEHNRVVGSSTGVNASLNTFANVRECYFGGLTGTVGAVRAGTGSTVNIENSMFVNNNIGVNVNGGTIRLSNNEFFQNNTGVANGTAESANNNRFRGNTVEGATTNVIVVK